MTNILRYPKYAHEQGFQWVFAELARAVELSSQEKEVGMESLRCQGVFLLPEQYWVYFVHLKCGI